MDEGSLAAVSKGGADGGASLMELITDRMKQGIFTMGAALVAALLRGALDRGVEVVTGARGQQLVTDDVGRVVGLKVNDNQLINARRGVVLACGGYEWNAELVKAFLPVPEVVPLSPPGNEGDGLIMGLEAGAALGNMGSAWWYPAMRDPTMSYEGQPLYHLGAGRNLAGVIVVNRHGRRFVNEGTTYQDMPRAFLTYDPVALDYPNQAPVWMIFDRRVKDRQLVLNIYPNQPAPDWVARADTLEGLAKEIGIDGDGLAETVSRFNQYVEAGHDPDFARGTFFWENFMEGGPTPATSLRRIDEPPFYALPIYHGVLGTNGGLRIDSRARVRALRGGVIDGLYAAGNVTASVFGPAYPGGGATLGPALTFGYLAGRDLGAE
jgi:succinate dehydrogenase/fumarate reductase flavoprotein subunit